MRQVTPDEVRAACIAANITRIDHHDCAACGSWVFYSVEAENLFFNPACDCGGYRRWPEPREWLSASDWINMQDDEGRPKTAAKFGISQESFKS